MKIDLKTIENKNLDKDEIFMELQYARETQSIKEFIEYINCYELDYKNKVIVVNDKYEYLEIYYKDIIMFYSNKKNNYCKTNTGKYKIKSKLYEIEEMDKDFIRISKSCIVNINHVEKFDLNETGKIIIRLDDLTEEIVSRRKTKDIMNYLDDRRI